MKSIPYGTLYRDPNHSSTLGVFQNFYLEIHLNVADFRGSSFLFFQMQAKPSAFKIYTHIYQGTKNKKTNCYYSKDRLIKMGPYCIIYSVNI